MFSFADVLLSDVGEQQAAAIAAWIEANIKPAQLFPLARTYWPAYLTNAPLFDRTIYLRPKVEIGRLYWPRGASRFASAHFVVDQQSLESMRAATQSQGTPSPATLTMDDGQWSIETDLWMLPAWPLSTAATGPSNLAGMYLVTLVDDRYWWWDKDATFDVQDGQTEWEDLYTEIGDALGVDITVDPIPEQYLTPTTDYSYANRPLPIILDAVAWSVGQVIVRQFDGSVEAMGFSKASTILASNLASFWQVYAGGQFAVVTGQ